LVDELDLREFWHIILRRQWFAIGALCFVWLCGIVYYIQTPRIYKATAKVIIENAAPLVLGKNVQDVYNLGTTGFYATRQYYATQYKMITSHPVAAKTVSALGLRKEALINALTDYGAANTEDQIAQDPLRELPPKLQQKLRIVGLSHFKSRDEIVEHLEKIDIKKSIQSRIIVEPILESHLVNISIEGTNPEDVSLIANAVANAYIDVNLDQKILLNETALGWLSGQLVELKKQVTDSENRLHNFIKIHPSVSIAFEDKQSMISQTLQNLNEALSTTTTKRLAMEPMWERLKHFKQSNYPVALLANPTNQKIIADLKTTFSQLTQEKAALQVKYTESHPQIISLNKKIALITKDLSQETDTLISEFEQNFRSLLETEKKLALAIDKAKEQAVKANKTKLEYERLERDSQQNLDLYSLVLNRQKETQLTQMLKVNNVRVLERSTIPTIPIKPKPRIVLLLTLLVSLLVAFATVFIVNTVDNTIKSELNISRDLKLTFLGILPIIKSETDTEAITSPSRDQFIAYNLRSSIAECARNIRTNIMFLSREKHAKSFLVTSHGPQEGKSTVAINLAITMAQSGLKTIIVDTDMRRPRIHKSFEQPNDTGLCNAILDECHISELIRKTGILNLDFLACGPIPPNPAELLHGKKFTEVLNTLKATYDRIILDSPPVGPVTDAVILGTMADGVILVIQANKSTIPEARGMRDRLLNVQARILGVVLNKIDLESHSSKGYSYNYDYYKSGYYYTEENTNKKASA